MRLHQSAPTYLLKSLIWEFVENVCMSSLKYLTISVFPRKTVSSRGILLSYSYMLATWPALSIIARLHCCQHVACHGVKRLEFEWVLFVILSCYLYRILSQILVMVYLQFLISFLLLSAFVIKVVAKRSLIVLIPKWTNISVYLPCWKREAS